jgi:hypothetical protein
MTGEGGMMDKEASNESKNSEQPEGASEHESHH